MVNALPQGRREWLAFTLGALLVLCGAVIFEWWEDDPGRPWNQQKE